MKVLILDSYYRGFLMSFYRRRAELAASDYRSAHAVLMRQRFGTSDAYSRWLTPLGHDVEEVVANDDLLQAKWAAEHGLRTIRLPTAVSHALSRAVHWDFRFRILRAQVRASKPDVLYVQEHNILTDRMLAALKPHCRLLVAQVASPIPTHRTYRHYDLVLTSFPHYVERFRAQGIAAEYFRLGFDERLLSELALPEQRTYACTFVGGVSTAHTGRLAALRCLAAAGRVDVFGYANGLPATDPLLRRHHGEVWGLDMYRTLGDSRTTVNYHIDAAGHYANNMRLYEATGMACCLLTDWKSNLETLFEPENEVVTYRTVDELIDKVKMLDTDAALRQRVAAAGHQRVLREHTWRHRMLELSQILSEHLR